MNKVYIIKRNKWISANSKINEKKIEGFYDFSQSPPKIEEGGTLSKSFSWNQSQIDITNTHKKFRPIIMNLDTKILHKILAIESDNTLIGFYTKWDIKRMQELFI